MGGVNTGKGQEKLQKTSEQRSAQQHQTGVDAQKRLLDGSAEFQAYKKRVAGRRSTIESGTYADSADFLSNKDAVAQRKATYDATASLKPTGLGALAMNQINPKAVADQERVRADEFARDSAIQAQADKRGYIADTEAMESDIIGKNLGVDSTIMGAAFGQSNYNQSLAAQIAAQRASIVPSIIGGVISGASQVAGAYLGRPPS